MENGYKMLSDFEAIQQTLDYLKSKFNEHGRIGTEFALAHITFTKDFPESDKVQLFKILKLQLVDSGLFSEVPESNGSLRLSKEGRRVKDFYNWKYQDYLNSKKSTDTLLKRSAIANVILAVLVLIQVILGILEYQRNSEIQELKATIKELQSKGETTIKDYCHSCAEN